MKNANVEHGGALWDSMGYLVFLKVGSPTRWGRKNSQKTPSKNYIFPPKKTCKKKGDGDIW